MKAMKQSFQNSSFDFLRVVTEMGKHLSSMRLQESTETVIINTKRS